MNAIKDAKLEGSILTITIDLAAPKVSLYQELHPLIREARKQIKPKIIRPISIRNLQVYCDRFFEGLTFRAIAKKYNICACNARRIYIQTARKLAIDYPIAED